MKPFTLSSSDLTAWMSQTSSIKMTPPGTRLVGPGKFTVAALIAPEVYMSLNNIEFSDISVSADREALADSFRPEDVEGIRRYNQELLEVNVSVSLRWYGNNCSKCTYARCVA